MYIVFLFIYSEKIEQSTNLQIIIFTNFGNHRFLVCWSFRHLCDHSEDIMDGRREIVRLPLVRPI